MRAAAAANDWNVLVNLDLRFHEILVGSLQPRRLHNCDETLMVETRMSLSQLGKYYPGRYEIADEHRLLIDCVALGDSAEMDDVVDKHLGHAGRQNQFEATVL